VGSADADVVKPAGEAQRATSLETSSGRPRRFGRPRIGCGPR
jgi:hypothetical protein